MTTMRLKLTGAGLAGALALLAPFEASAGDLYRRDHVSLKDAPVIVPVPTWAGFYAGVHLGVLFDHDNADFEGPAAFTFFDSGDDGVFIGGVHVGYNWQKGQKVFGIEGDVSFAEDIGYLASIRARLGWAAGNWLFYVTGGVAFIETEYSFRVTDGAGGTFRYSPDHDEVGFVVGLGTEVKLQNNWSLGVEGLYYGFEEDERVYTIPAGAFSYENELDFWAVRARLSYHFPHRHAEPLK